MDPGSQKKQWEKGLGVKNHEWEWDRNKIQERGRGREKREKERMKEETKRRMKDFQFEIQQMVYKKDVNVR